MTKMTMVMFNTRVKAGEESSGGNVEGETNVMTLVLTIVNATIMGDIDISNGNTLAEGH